MLTGSKIKILKKIMISFLNWSHGKRSTIPGIQCTSSDCIHLGDCCFLELLKCPRWMKSPFRMLPLRDGIESFRLFGEKWTRQKLDRFGAGVKDVRESSSLMMGSLARDDTDIEEKRHISKVLALQLLTN